MYHLYNFAFILFNCYEFVKIFNYFFKKKKFIIYLNIKIFKLFFFLEFKDENEYFIKYQFYINIKIIIYLID